MLFNVESYIFGIQNKTNQTFFSHPTNDEIAADIFHLNNVVFAYSVAVVFSNDSSDSCAVLLANNLGNLIATTKFVNRYVNFLLMLFKLLQ